MGLAQDLAVVGGLVVVGIVGLFFLARGIGQSLEGFKFPEITIPSFPEITFPSFPDINITLPPIFGGPPGEPLPGEVTDGEVEPGVLPTEPFGDIQIPAGCTVDNLGRVSCPTPPTFDVCSIFPDLCPGEEIPLEPRPQPPPVPSVGGSLEVVFTPAPTPPPPIVVAPGIEGEFVGGGPSFEGGTIFETPICNLSLSQIIDQGLASSASQAASIRAEACGFTPDEEEFLTPSVITPEGTFPGGGGPPAVSDPAFEGLTPEQIAAIITGGS